MYGKKHYNIVISLQLIKINGKKKKAETLLLNCGVEEDSWEFVGLQEDPTSPS